MSRIPASRERRSHRAGSVSRAIGLTLLGTLIPGLGLVLAGRAKLGAFIMTLSIGLLAIGAYVGLTQRNAILALAVDPRQLLITAAVVVLLGFCWICVVVSSHRLLRPVNLTAAGRFAGSAFVGLICFAIAVPTTVAAQTVMAQRDLVGSVFASQGSPRVPPDARSTRRTRGRTPRA